MLRGVTVTSAGPNPVMKYSRKYRGALSKRRGGDFFRPHSLINYGATDTES